MWNKSKKNTLTSCGTVGWEIYVTYTHTHTEACTKVHPVIVVTV